MKKSKSPTKLKFNFTAPDKDKVLKFVPALPIILQDNVWSKLLNMKGSIERSWSRNNNKYFEFFKW
ncbi:MAG TPA: hypothetical protein LFV90_06210 [Rickettsia endosymbiont of Columbicola hoogstraali]|nr:hypothetical protein [Rickettsia endosymbiont of Columbicola hoogstraali]